MTFVYEKTNIVNEKTKEMDKFPKKKKMKQNKCN